MLILIRCTCLCIFVKTCFDLVVLQPKDEAKGFPFGLLKSLYEEVSHFGDDLASDLCYRGIEIVLPQVLSHKV